MTIASYQPTVGIQLSDAARAHIQKEIEKSADKTLFKLHLQTSGCSGFMYETELVSEAAANEQLFEFDGVTIIVPNKDLPILNGTEIDFVKQGLNSMFQFKNPNVTGECGCGESFSVTEDEG